LTTALVTINETAELTHLSPATVRYYIQQDIELGPLFGTFGRRRMARRSDVQAWIESKLPPAGDHSGASKS
jgi:hypothetical protein